MAGFGGAVKLTGESEYKAALKAITQNLKEVSSEMKVVTSLYGKNDTSIAALTAKQDVLNKKLTEQKNKLDLLKNEYKQMESQYNSSTKEHQELVDSYNKESAKLKELENTVGVTSDEYKQQEKVVQDLEKELMKSSAAQDANEKSMSQMRIQINNAEADVNKTTRSLDELEKALDDSADAGDDLGDAMDDAGDSAKQANDGFTVMKGILADLAANAIRACVEAMKDFARQTIETGMNFDSAMAEVGAISGATDAELQMLRDTAKEFGSTTMFSASEAAEALKYMSLAGWDANTSAAALGGVLDLAAASGMDLGAASDMVTDYLSAFGMEAQQSGYFADLLAYAQKNANLTTENLGEAFKNSAANMNAAGQDIETTTSLLAMLANQGLKGSEAGTALAAMMRDLTAKMKDGKIMIGDTAVTVMDANGNYRDMTAILKDVEAATNGMGDAERAAALSSTFTSDSIKGLNMILNAGVDEAAKFEDELRKSSITTEKLSETMKQSGVNADAFKSSIESAGLTTDEFDEILNNSGGTVEGLMNALNESGVDAEVFKKSLNDAGISVEDLGSAMENTMGTAAEMASTMQDNLGGDLTSLSSQFEGVQIALYEKFEPALRSGVDVLSEMLDGLQFVIDHSSEFIAVLAAMAAGIASYVAYTTALTVMKEGWMALTVVEKGAAAAQAVLNAVMAANPIGIIIAAVAALIVAIGYLWKTNEGFRKNVIKVWNAILKGIKSAIEAIKNVVTTVFTAIYNVITDIWNSIKNVINTVLNVISTVITTYINIYKTIITTGFNVIKTVVTTVWDAIKSAIDTVLNVISTIFTTYINAYKTIITTGFNAIKAVVTAVWDGIKTVTSNVWNGIKSVVTTAVNNVKSAVSNGLNGIKSTVTSIWNSIKSTTSSVWNSIKSAIQTPINAARDAVKSAIDKIKSFFNFKISWPHIPVPHFSISPSGWKIGDLLKGVIPSLSIKWYKTGGVFDRPTVLTGVGENGAEAIVPLENNTKWIKRVAEELSDFMFPISGLSNTLNSLSNSAVADYNYNRMVDAFKDALSQMTVELDDDQVGKFVVKTVENAIYT